MQVPGVRSWRPAGRPAAGRRAARWSRRSWCRSSSDSPAASTYRLVSSQCEAGLRVDAADRAEHLRGEQDVVGRRSPRAAGRSRPGGRRRCRRRRCAAVVARVRPAEPVGQARGSGPSGTGTAPPPCGITNRSVGNRSNRSPSTQLHEHRGVGVEVVRAERVEVRVAGRRHVHHRRHVELDHRLVEREPVRVGQRRRGPVPAGRVGVEVAADEAELLDAPAQLGDRRRRARRPGVCGSWQTAGEVVGEQLGHPVRPGRCTPAPRRRAVAGSGTWCSIADACGEKSIRSPPRSRSTLQLVVLDALADLVVADRAPARARQDGSAAGPAARRGSRWCCGRRRSCSGRGSR